MRYKCIVSYDGTLFHGFQTQDIKSELVNPRTIQETIENAVSNVINEKANITYASRTDAKVHALGQVFHFDTTLNISEYNMKKAINSYLPADIYIKSVSIVSDEFNARSNVIKKEYHYVINLGEYNPLRRDYEYTYPYKNLDINLMKECSSVLLGKHDFRSFTKAKNLANYEREIYDIKFIEEGNLLTIVFIGNGFLHNMVRILAAMLLECGKGNYTKSELKEILEQKNRQFAPKILPANGLYLIKVYYKEDL